MVSTLRIKAPGQYEKRSSFTFIGTGAFSGNGAEIRYEHVWGWKTKIEADTDGDEDSDIEIDVYGLINFNQNDFIL